MNRRLLSILIVIGLTAGCAPPTRSLLGHESSPTVTDTLESEGTKVRPIVEPTETATTQTTLPESRPPAVEELSTPTPVEIARVDLAHRLNADVQLVKVADVTTRAPDPEDMSCLTDGSIPEALWMQADAVQWIALSVKGNVHHYVALGDLVVYCEK